MAQTTEIILSADWVEVVELGDSKWSLENAGNSIGFFLLSNTSPDADTKGHHLERDERADSEIFGLGRVWVKGKAGEVLLLTRAASTPVMEATADETDTITGAASNIIYKGYCKPGTLLTSEAAWAILRIDTSNGAQNMFADGLFEYSQVWDNRASLTYTYHKF